MSTLDRYLIRQTLPPFFLALGIFTFALAIQPMLEQAKLLLAKGVSVGTIGVLLSTLLPFALSVTIPMAFLTGVLMMLGRVSNDRESVAMLACGVSPWRLLRPLLVLSVAVGLIDMATIMWATPNANQTYRTIAFRLLQEKTSSDIKPRVFFTQFPGKVLYIGDVAPDGRWLRVLVADTTDSNRPTVTLAETGTLIVDRELRLVRIVLEKASRYEPGRTDPRLYTVSQQTEPVSVAISAESVFGGQVIPGLREKTYSQLDADIARHHAAGTPPHAEIMQQQQMFAFPVACIVFALLGLTLGLSTRKEGRLAGMTLGLAVIIGYYAIMALAEAHTKNVARTDIPGVDVVATWARWIPDIVLGIAGLFALRFQARPSSGNGWLARLSAALTRPRSAETGQEPSQQGGAERGTSRPVVVLRVSRRGLPGPRLLDRYVAGRFLSMISLAFLGLLVLYYVGTFLDFSDKIFRESSLPTVFASYLIQSTPQFIVFIIPIAVLVAVLATIGGLTRTNELVVMRACGVSLYRVALPLVAFALVGSALLFGIDESVLGEANKTRGQLEDQLRGRKPRADTVMLASTQWLVGEDERIYAYAGFGAETRTGGHPTLQSLSVFEPAADHPYRLRSHLHAARAGFDGTTWQVEHGWEERFKGAEGIRTDFERKAIALAPVQDFQRAQIDPSTMTFVEYRNYVRRLGESGFNVAEQRVNLYRKVAFPMVTVVMTLLAIPFGVTIGKKGALYGIGLAAMIAGAYFLLMTIFVAAGSAALLPPMLAAWGANLIFGAAAGYMLLTVRT